MEDRSPQFQSRVGHHAIAGTHGSSRLILRRCAWLFLVIAGLPAWSQTGRTVSLEACLKNAETNSRELLVARQQALAAEASRREARAMMLPSIMAEGAFQRLSPNIPDFEITIPEGLFPDLGSGDVVISPAFLERYETTVRVQQPVFRGFELASRTRQAAHRSAAARHGRSEARDRVTYRVHEAYWQLFSGIAQRDAIEAAQRQVRTHLEDTERLLEQGMALESDVLAVRTRVAEVDLQAIEAENAVRVSQLNLARAAGFPLDSDLIPSDSPDTVGSVQLPETEDDPVASRADLAAQRELVEATSAGLRAARSSWYPAVSVFWEGLYARPNMFIQPPEDTFKATWAAGVHVQMNLWNGGRRSAGSQRAAAEAQEQKILLEDMREQALVEVRRSRLELNRASAAVEAGRIGLDEARAAYENVGNRHARGLAQTSELLDAEVAFRSAETRLTGALADLEIARAVLAFAAGEIASPYEE